MKRGPHQPPNPLRVPRTTEPKTEITTPERKIPLLADEKRNLARAAADGLSDKVHEDWGGRILFAAVMGSHAYGLDGENSDVDVRAIHAVDPVHFLEMVPRVTPSSPAATVSLGDGTDSESTELGKFCSLALNGNPSILEFLFVPTECVLLSSPEYAFLRANRQKFLGKRRMRNAYLGYATGQFFRMLPRGPMKKPAGDHRPPSMATAIELLREESDIDAVDYDLKNATHNLRLLMSLNSALTSGDLQVRVEGGREALRNVKEGRVPLSHFLEMMAEQEAQVPANMEASELPEDPDMGFVTDFVRRFRLRMLNR
jgi:hypothetical protein